MQLDQQDFVLIDFFDDSNYHVILSILIIFGVLYVWAAFALSQIDDRSYVSSDVHLLNTYHVLIDWA